MHNRSHLRGCNLGRHATSLPLIEALRDDPNKGGEDYHNRQRNFIELENIDVGGVVGHWL